MKNKFYSYVYLTEEGFPYYVGKGKGRRWKKQHNCLVPPRGRVLIFPCESEEVALALEERLIRWLGLESEGGFLLNKQKKPVNNCPQNPVRISAPPGTLPPLTRGESNLWQQPTDKEPCQTRVPKRGSKKPKEVVILGITYPSISAAARKLGVERRVIRNFLAGKTSCSLFSHHTKAVICEGQVFRSLREAARAFCLDKAAIRWRVESPHWKGWCWQT